jgi:hypothetical protein
MFRSLMPIGLAAALAASSFATAQNGADDVAPEDMVNCVSLSRVDDTRIVDDQTILFYMTDSEIYRNVLPHRCPGLDRNSTFMYRVTTTQLCSVDVITLLDDFGSRFMPAASCGLGKFQPISEAEAEEIIRVAERDDGSE